MHCQGCGTSHPEDNPRFAISDTSQITHIMKGTTEMRRHPYDYVLRTFPRCYALQGQRDISFKLITMIHCKSHFRSNTDSIQNACNTHHPNKYVSPTFSGPCALPGLSESHLEDGLWFIASRTFRVMRVVQGTPEVCRLYEFMFQTFSGHYALPGLLESYLKMTYD